MVVVGARDLEEELTIDPIQQVARNGDRQRCELVADARPVHGWIHCHPTGSDPDAVTD